MVLIVEDSADLADLIVDSLSTEPWECRTASDGSRALALLRDGLKPGLILLDGAMPGMGGREFVSQLRADPVLKHIPVVAMTGADETVRGADVQGLLRKPFELDRLIETVRKYLDGASGEALPGRVGDGDDSRVA
jgi:CheY-like chemotaxis protein